MCTMEVDRRAPDANRDAFPADRWTELRLESSLGHREPFVNPLGRVCPSVNSVNRQSPSTPLSSLLTRLLLTTGRMHNQNCSVSYADRDVHRSCQIAKAREFSGSSNMYIYVRICM